MRLRPAAWSAISDRGVAAAELPRPAQNALRILIAIEPRFPDRMSVAASTPLLWLSTPAPS